MKNLYSETDDILRVAILATLAVDERTANADLRVGVLNGIAHLAGKVDTLAKRTAAEELTLQVDGVRGVANRIEAPGAPNPARTIHLSLEKESSASKK
jgi:osmotically-inducible protein OsmY